MKRVAITLALLLLPSSATATGFTDIGQDIRAQVETTVEFHGALRQRSELLHNLDLDRGPTTSGELLFPVPLSDPSAQTLTHFDLRLRTDIAFIAPSVGTAVRLRIDLLDNLSMGSIPDNVPSATASQRPPEEIVRIRRAYGQVLTPIGLFAVGRMGNHWGLGMLANSGDCADCDSGDAADRFAFLTPVLGHVWALAFDLTTTAPLGQRRTGRAIDLDPTDNTRTITFALLNFRDDLARDRRRRAGKITFEYGAYVSHRWQNNDVPSSYLSVADPTPSTPSQVMARGLRATAIDGWLRLSLPIARLELEVAAILAEIEEPSLLPGALLRTPLTSTQFGAAFETEFGDPDSPFHFGLDGGFASGDPTFGFGVFVDADDAAPHPGDIDGPQTVPPYDYTVDNFRFHPDYRIDRILFREIIGTVTDAVYIRPHVRWTAHEFNNGSLSASLVGIASWAIEANSTPGGESPLGFELNPTVAYENRSGFNLALEYGVLFPFSGLSNPNLGLPAQPAQLARLRIGFVY